MAKKIKILVVEDESIVGEDIRRSLDNLGYHVVDIISTGEEALKNVAALEPDLVIMDIVLHGKLNGIQAAELLREQYDIPVIYLTAYADDSTLEKAKLTEPYGYLIKPFEDRELYSTIEMALYKYRIENKLKKNEAWLSTTLNSIGDGVVATNEKGQIVFINTIAENLTGWYQEEAIKLPLKKVFQIVNEESGSPVSSPVKKILKSEVVQELEKNINLVDRKGNAIPIEGSGAPIQDEDGHVHGVVLGFRDISEKRRVRKALEERDEFNFALFHYNPIETVVVDLKGRVIGWNKMKEESGDRLPKLGDLMYKDYAGSHEIDMHQELLNCIQTGRVKEFPEQKYMERFLHITIAPFSAGAIITSVDITERRQSEKALKESEEKYRTLLKTSPDSIILSDLKGDVIYISERTLEMHGYTDPESLIGTSFYQLMDEGDHKRLKQYYNKVLSEGLVKGEEFQMLCADGSHYTGEINMALIKDTGGDSTSIVVATRDITLRKKVEEEKASMQMQLLQVQKMEAVGTLTGGVAHDFNNLLTAIQGCADMMIMKTDEGNELYREMREIQDATGRAADLTRQLLLFSRKQPMAFSTLDLNRTVENLLRMLHRLIGEDIGISTAFEDDLWAMKGDRGTLEQIIMNLVVNAKQAMPEGGTVTIRTDNIVLDEADIKRNPEAGKGQCVRLTVIDSGIGMSQEVISHIFEPFYSTKGPGSGTGLGLAVVYGIVKQHGGWITVNSEPGKGSTFEIYFPAAAGRTIKKEKEIEDVDKLQGKGERVLVVEDENTVREFISFALEENGYDIFTATTAEEAFTLYLKEKGNFDLVIADVVLPDKSGVQLVKKLLKQRKDQKILFSSGYTDQKSQWEEIQKMGFQFLQKPYPLIAMLQTIRNIINQS